MDGLAQWHERHPWDPKWRRYGAPIETLWEFLLPVSVDELRPHLTDTSAFNARLGLTQMHFQETEDGRLLGWQRSVGTTVEWEEVPWNRMR